MLLVLKLTRKFLFKTGLISLVKKILYRENIHLFNIFNTNIKKNSFLYRIKTKIEISNYSENVNIHDNPPIHKYWFNKFILPKLSQYGYLSINDFYLKKIINIYKKSNNKISILSIGSGNCDLEFFLANDLYNKNLKNFIFECADINQFMLKRAIAKIKYKSYQNNFIFTNTDFNTLKTEFAKYDVVIANMCLHHVLDLEELFHKIKLLLRNNKSRFLSYDMIGRNGHMRYPEAMVEINKVWSSLPKSKKHNHYLGEIQDNFINYDCSRAGFEGIRSQDILKLLNKQFYFETFFGFANIVEPFVDRAYGPNYDPKNLDDRKLIDNIHKIDEKLLKKHKLTPTHMISSMTKNKISLKEKFYNGSVKTWIRG